MKKKNTVNNELKGKLSQIFYPNNSKQDQDSDGNLEPSHNLYSQHKTYAIKPKRNDSATDKKYGKNISNRYNIDNYSNTENPVQKSNSGNYMKQNFKIHQDQYLKLKNANSDKILKPFNEIKKRYDFSTNRTKDIRINETNPRDSQTSRNANNYTNLAAVNTDDNRGLKNFFKINDKQSNSPSVNKQDILKNNKSKFIDRNLNSRAQAADKLKTFLNKQGNAYTEKMSNGVKINRNNADFSSRINRNDEISSNNSNMLQQKVVSVKLNVFDKLDCTKSNDNLINRQSRNANSLDRKNYVSSREQAAREQDRKRDLSNAQQIDNRNSEIYQKNKKKLKKIAIMNKNDVNPRERNNDGLYKNYDFINSANSIDVLKINNGNSVLDSVDAKNPTLPKILTTTKMGLGDHNKDSRYSYKNSNLSNNNTKNDSMQKTSRPSSRNPMMQQNDAQVTKDDTSYDLISAKRKVNSYRVKTPTSNNTENVMFKPDVFSLISNDSSNNIYKVNNIKDPSDNKRSMGKQVVFNHEIDSQNNDSTNNLNLYKNRDFQNSQKSSLKENKRKGLNISITPKNNLKQVNLNHITPKNVNQIDLSHNSNHVQEKGARFVNNKFRPETKLSTSPPSSQNLGDISDPEKKVKILIKPKKTIYDNLDRNYIDLPKINLYYMKKLYTFWIRTDISHYFAETFRNHFVANWKHIRYGYNCAITNQKDLKEVRFLKEKNVEDLNSLQIETYNNGTSSNRKKILVLDLDETLVHCKAVESLTESTRAWDKKIKITMSAGGLVDVYIFYRPKLMEFLKNVSKYWEVCIFTASNPNYANPVIDTFDPTGKYIKARYYRDSCINNEKGYWVKDLGMFKERCLKDIVIVDNSASCYISNIENAIPMLPYIDNNADNELKDLEEFLIWLSKKEDVREPLKRVFGLGKMCYCNTVEEAYEKVLNYYIK